MSQSEGGLLEGQEQVASLTNPYASSYPAAYGQPAYGSPMAYDNNPPPLTQPTYGRQLIGNSLADMVLWMSIALGAWGLFALAIDTFFGLVSQSLIALIVAWIIDLVIIYTAYLGYKAAKYEEPGVTRQYFRWLKVCVVVEVLKFLFFVVSSVVDSLSAEDGKGPTPFSILVGALGYALAVGVCGVCYTKAKEFYTTTVLMTQTDYVAMGTPVPQGSPFAGPTSGHYDAGPTFAPTPAPAPQFPPPDPASARGYAPQPVAQEAAPEENPGFQTNEDKL